MFKVRLFEVRTLHGWPGKSNNGEPRYFSLENHTPRTLVHLLKEPNADSTATWGVVRATMF
jgi:hypothetical protein